jgi:fructose-bisphosphate aldolase class 1
MAIVDLESIAQAFVAEGKGILVADETPQQGDRIINF